MGDADQKALNALAKGAGVTAVGMVFSKVLTYFYRISIARFVGPSAYGQLSLALVVTGIASTVAYLSMGSGLRKFIPEYRTNEEFEKIKGTVLGALQMCVPFSILVWAVIFFGSEFIALNFFNNESVIPLIKIISFTIITGVITDVFFDTTLGFNKIIYKTGTIRILQNAIKLVVTLILLFAGFEVVSAAWGWLAGSILSMILGFYFLENKIGPIITSNVKPIYNRKELLKFSSPLLLSGLIATIMGWADTALLGYYMRDFEVGLYNAALPTAMLVLLPHTAIGSLAISSFSELKERNDESIQNSIQRATYWVFSLVFPTFLIMTLFSKQSLFILFGSEYTSASLALSILAFGHLFDALVGQVGSFLQSKGYTKYILYNNVAALTLNLVLNVLLIPIFGIIGAAIATTSTTILTNVLMFIEVWRKEKIISMPFVKIGKIVLIGLLPLIPILGFDKMFFNNTPYWFMFIGGFIYLIMYTMLFLMFLGLGKEEKEVLERLGEVIGYREEINLIIGKC